MRVELPRPEPLADELTPVFAEEPTTAPQLATERCPACAGAGKALRTLEIGTRYRTTLMRCEACAGSGLVTPEQARALRRTR